MVEHNPLASFVPLMTDFVETAQMYYLFRGVVAFVRKPD